MFEHPMFDIYGFEDIPRGRDLYLMDQVWMEPYEKCLERLFAGGEYENVGFVSYVAAKSGDASNLELSWYARIDDRFHEVRVNLPREEFVTCAGSWRWDEKPRIFAKSGWIEKLHRKLYSVFALVDASDFKRALKTGCITRDRLVALRGRIDSISEKYPNFLFISYADSLLLKSNWRVGYAGSGIEYTYEPEQIIRLVSDIHAVYSQELGLAIYAVLTQGSNEYYDDPLAHISASMNHISLNSLGLPFAQLQTIDQEAKKLSKTSGRAELYMEHSFFRSLRLRLEFGTEGLRKHSYEDPLTGKLETFVCAQRQQILENLRKGQ